MDTELLSPPQTPPPPQESPRAQPAPTTPAPRNDAEDYPKHDMIAFPPPAETAEAPKKHKRTAGLKIFDILVYPFFTNFVVMGISIAATYLTSHGGDLKADGSSAFGAVGRFFQRRGDWMIQKFENMNMTHDQADMAKMVLFSFVDGSFVAPGVDLLERKRTQIAHAIDRQLGTVSKDPAVYEAEPKQNWGSILGGRGATAAVVVPTAVLMEKTGMNDKLFTRVGQRIADWVERTPAILKRIPSHINIPFLSKTLVFEAFYTSVCTTGLYYSSRLFARQMEHKPKVEKPPAPAAVDRYEMLTPNRSGTAWGDRVVTGDLAVQPVNQGRGS